LDTAPAFDATVKHALSGRPKLLIADLSDLTFINSNGMYVLLKADIRLSREGGHVVVMGARPEVKVALDLIGLPQRIRFVSNLAEARATPSHKRHACRSNA
jgi:anti-anti-sigma factor